eukprot:TRINITY_DN1332_c0_g1_i1.p1 TRINITY_DN1332_c0_g1~~TRINITY_DN1332_c0_g1_i1.p1  ORF type:complete len:597 (-),score=37.99 TRINITY_DN1332_c0_g1_i1:113-1903(-)
MTGQQPLSGPAPTATMPATGPPSQEGGQPDRRGYQTLAVEPRVNHPTVDVQYSANNVAECLLVKCMADASRRLDPGILFVLPGQPTKAEVWSHEGGQSSRVFDILSQLEPLHNLYIPVNMSAWVLRSNVWGEPSGPVRYTIEVSCGFDSYTSLPICVVGSGGVPNYFPPWNMYDSGNDPSRPRDDLRKGLYLPMVLTRGNPFSPTPAHKPARPADPLAVLAGLCATELGDNDQSMGGQGAVVQAAPGAWRGVQSPSTSSDSPPANLGTPPLGRSGKSGPTRIKSITARVAKRDRAMSVPEAPPDRASPTEEVRRSHGRKRAFSVGHYSVSEATQGGRKRANTVSDAGLSDHGSVQSSPHASRRGNPKNTADDGSGGFGINPYSKCASCSFLSALRQGAAVYQAYQSKSTWKSLYKLAMCLHAGEKATGKALHRGGCHRSRKDIQNEFQLHFCANKYTWHQMPKDGSHPRRLCSRFKPEWELVVDGSDSQSVASSKDSAKRGPKSATSGPTGRPRKDSITTVTKNALDKLSLAASSKESADTGSKKGSSNVMLGSPSTVVSAATESSQIASTGPSPKMEASHGHSGSSQHQGVMASS